jgi:hypothetical protein
MKIILMRCMVALACLVLWASCKDDAKVNKFAGRWEVVGGTLNKLSTDQFNGFYLEMSPDGALKSNINTEANDETGTYQLKGNTLVQNTSEKIRFDVEKVEDSLMQLATEMRGMEFVFVLKKK